MFRTFRRDIRKKVRYADEQLRIFGRRCVAFGSKVFVVSHNRSNRGPVSAALF